MLMAVGMCGEDLKTFGWRIPAYMIYISILIVMGLYKYNNNIYTLYLYYDMYYARFYTTATYE